MEIFTLKKIVSIIVLAALTLFVTACGDSNSTVRTHALTDVEKKLIGDWKGSNGRGTYIYLEVDNKIIAVNEDGNRDQLKVDGKSISAMTWKVQPRLSDDGKSLDWGNGTAWAR